MIQFILKTVVNALGGVETSEKKHVDTYTEKRIKTVNGEQIAFTEHGGIWAEFQELTEFQFMNITVIGKTKFKTYDGCQLIFVSNHSELHLVSDTLEIESDYSNVSERWITEISFDITDKNIEMITHKEAIKVHLNFKKNSESFDIIK